MLATIMQALDTTIANVALPHMQATSAPAQDQITWVLTSYIVAAAIMTPLTGWLADRFGRKRAVPDRRSPASPSPRCCAASPPASTRWCCSALLQGVFGAALVPLSQAVLLDINPQEKHGQAMAMWGAGIMVGPILGPTLGGWLTETLQLALGVLHQPAGRHPGLPRLRRLPAADRAAAARLRLLRLRHAVARRRRAAADARPRRQVDWFSSTEIWIELGLAHHRLLGLRRPHRRPPSNPFIDPKIFADRNFVDRPGLHLRRRHHPARRPGAAAADAAEAVRLSDVTPASSWRRAASAR